MGRCRMRSEEEGSASALQASRLLVKSPLCPLKLLCGAVTAAGDALPQHSASRRHRGVLCGLGAPKDMSVLQLKGDYPRSASEQALPWNCWLCECVIGAYWHVGGVKLTHRSVPSIFRDSSRTRFQC